MIQPLNEQFIRMQKLAGVAPTNVKYNKVLEGINIYSQIMGYNLLITEADGAKTKKIDTETQVWFQGLDAVYNALDPQEKEEFEKAFKEAVKGIKSQNLSPEDVKQALNQNLSEADEENPNKSGYKFMAPLNKFLDSTSGKISKVILALTIGAAILAPKIGNTIKALTPDQVTTVSHNVDIDQIGGGDDKTVSWDDAKAAGANDGEGNSLQDLEDEKNSSTEFVKFDFGKGSENGLSPEGNEAIDDIVTQLQTLDNAGGGEVTIDIDGEASNTGDGSDIPDDGEGSLADNRAETVKAKIQQKVDQLDLKNIKVNVTADDTPDDHYKTLEKTSKKDGNKGAGAIVTMTGDVESTETTTTPDKFDKDFNPAFKRWGWDFSRKKSTEEPTDQEKPSDEETPETSPNTSDKTGVVIPPLDMSDETPKKASPTQVTSDIKNISKLNRNGQLAMVLARMSPKLNIFSQLGKDTVTSLSDNDFKKIQDSNASETAKKLARLIPNLRKSPDAFLKKVSDLTGVELAPRAKAVATKPGAGTQAPTTPLTETQIYLQEAAIDDLFNELGITPEEIKTNRVEIIALLGSMYAADGNTDVSILDPSKLSKEEQKQLQSMGFASQPAGNYVYMKPGDTANQIRTGNFDRAQTKTKTQPDVDKFGTELGKRKDIQRYLQLINKKDELKELIVGVIGLVDPNLIKDKGKLRTIMFGMRNRITEEEKDTQTAIQNILRNPTLVTRLKNINTAEEAIQLVLREIIPYLNTDFKERKSDIRGAVIAAANELTNTETAADRSEKAAQNKSAQPTNESFLKMQKLAGVITESQYRKILNERTEVMNKRDDAEPDYQYRNIVKVQQYLDSNDDSEQYAQIIGFFVDNNDKIEKYHVRTFSTNDVNSRTSLSEWTPEDFKRNKAVKIDDNDSEIANTIKKHPKYVKY
jgi:hypothetical protein